MYKWFYNNIPVKKSVADESIHLLSDKEIKYIKKKENFTVFLAALIGAIMVLALYLPQYWFPSLFPLINIKLPFIEDPVELSIVAILYGFVLVFAEIILLTFLNIYCAHEIAYATGFINSETKHTEEKIQLIMSVGQQKKSKEIKNLGINPHHGLPNRTIILMNLFFTLQATLSNIFFKILVQRMLGRYALREVMDMLGIPIFAFWNALGTHKVLKEARVVIMGKNYLDRYKNELLDFRNLTEAEKEILYDTLQFIAVSKRDFHTNHYLLSKNIIERFNITIETEHSLPENYYEKLSNTETDFKKLNEQLLLLGFVLDGSLSRREIRRLKKLNDHQIVNRSAPEVKIILRNFFYGKGL